MGDMKMDPAIIPGLKTIRQPLKVNKLLKDYEQRFYSEWMAAGPHNPKLTRKIIKPLSEIICEWFILAWGIIPEKNEHQQFQVNWNFKCNGQDKK
jgi:hypothetical protein